MSRSQYWLSYWSPPLGSDHPLIFTKHCRWSGGRSKRMVGWVRISCVTQFTCQFSDECQMNGWKGLRPITPLNTGSLPRMHSILSVFWVMVRLVSLWHPRLLPGLCAFLTHASPSLMASVIMKHGSCIRDGTCYRHGKFQQVDWISKDASRKALETGEMICETDD